MPRTVVSATSSRIRLSPEVTLRRIAPGGKRGPKDEVLGDLIGGQVWSEMFMLGGDGNEPPLCVPDIRLPANQYWPLHWHDSWIAVIVLDGDCLIGDWHMKVGDVLISEDRLEYGPLVIGPRGCQMFEIFARLHPNEGGYARDFHDHPTLTGTTRSFAERSPRNAGNIGRQVVPIGGTAGLSKGHLTDGAQWDLGPADDADRAVMRSTHMAPGGVIEAHSYDDHHGMFLLDGDVTLGDHRLVAGDVLLIEPGGALARMEAGPGGAKWLEVARTMAGIDRRPIDRA